MYPGISDYIDAIKRPKSAFTRKNGKILNKSLHDGEPIFEDDIFKLSSPVYCLGAFAVAFKYTLSDGKTRAVRCFIATPDGTEQTLKNYHTIDSQLSELRHSSCSKFFLDCTYLDEGISVLDKIYPTLDMEWAKGVDLKKFIEKNINNKDKLNQLASIWLEMSENLHEAKISHGDIHHENVLIHDEETFSSNLVLKLVDYDSLYFGNLNQEVPDTIKGYPDYQHPMRHSLKYRSLRTDFFSLLIVYTSLKIFTDKPSVWNDLEMSKYDKRLLFSEADFKNPIDSPTFSYLSKVSTDLSSDTNDLVDKLKEVCQMRDLDSINPLHEIIQQVSYRFRSNAQPEIIKPHDIPYDKLITNEPPQSQSLWKLISGGMIAFSVCVSIFAYSQHQEIQKLKFKNEQTISNLNSSNEKSAKALKEEVDLKESLQAENKKMKVDIKEVSDENGVLKSSKIAKYTLTGELASKQSQNYKVPISESSLLDVYLYNLDQDIDMEITAPNGSTMPNFAKNSGGRTPEIVNRFPLGQSGDYLIKIWNLSDNKSNYNLNLYIQKNGQNLRKIGY